MIAAKAFDPVLGVDIHIIQPPGPVPPVPVPHPFVGMLIDPMDFAPVIGATVMVNGMPRATAGTGGKCIPPHIPIGGVFVKPPANECEVFMGSSTVLADGDPLSFLGMPALSCHDVGMVAPFRMKKKRKTKSLVLPTSVVLSVPAGAPVLVGGPPTISMMAMGMKAAMAGLGSAFRRLRSLQRGSRRMRALSDRIHGAARRAMDRLGVPPSVQNRVHRAVCTVTGHPVDVATGKVFTEAVDFELPGPIPLRWERVWYSCSTYDGPLGHGWHHCYDMALVEDREAGVVVVRMADGRAVAFPVLDEGETWFNSGERAALERDREGYRLRTPASLSYRFAAPASTMEPSALTCVEDDNANRIEFVYDVGGRLTAIRDSAGRTLNVRLDDQGRIRSIAVPDALDPRTTFAAVIYEYDGEGNLAATRDAVGAQERFEYQDRLLIQEIGRDGIPFRFEWDGSGPGARCVRTSGPDGLFGRQLVYDSAAGRTSTTDPSGHTVVYDWNERGLVNRITGPHGEEQTFRWNDDNRLESQTDPLGRTTSYAYDGNLNCTCVTHPDGTTAETVYDSRGRPTREVDASGAAWEYERDARGNEICIRNPLGHEIRYTYNDRGLPLQIQDAEGGITRLVWDVKGNLAMIMDALGRQTRFRHDGLGRLVSAVNPSNEVRRFEYDRAGRLRRYLAATGAVEEFDYDGIGRLVRYTDPMRRTRQFRYAFGDRPIERIDSGGRRIRFEYDHECRLTGVVNANGARHILSYDANDNLVAETDVDGRVQEYEYDGAGQVVRRIERAGDTGRILIVTEYVRDLAGRLIKKIAAGTVEEYAYDQVGRLVRADNDHCAVSFQYDLAGNLLTERQNDRTVVHAYDGNGKRKSTTYPDGDVISYDHDACGFLAALKLDGRRLVDVERDDSHRERRRTQGALETVFEYDPAGRLRQQAVSRRGEMLIARTYSYDPVGRLTELVDASGGAVRFGYDELGRILQVLAPQAKTVLTFDPADNIIDGAMAGRAKAFTNHVTSYGAIRYVYDSLGNVVSKTDGRRALQFRWDSHRRLKEVECTQGDSSVRTSYEYDALGRRITKRTDGSTTSYVWSGSQLIQERLSFQVTNYAYAPRSVVPIVRWSGSDVNHYHCDHLGSPRELTAHATGEIVWRSEYRLWERGSGTSVATSTPQPFRLPGQYSDEESGLHYNRFRYFDPDVGRYLTPDPIGLAGGFNGFAYAPDPINYVDPLGLATRRWVPLGDGWEAGVDTFNTGGSASHEIHVYSPGRTEVGVLGPDGGWIPKHGWDGTRPPSVTDDMCRRLNGVNVDQVRRTGEVVDRARSREMFNRTCGR